MCDIYDRRLEWMVLTKFKHPDWDFISNKAFNEFDFEWLRFYIKTRDLNVCVDENGNTLLHRAVQDNNKWAISQLGLLLVDPNIENDDGLTPLQLAQDLHPECVQHLHECHLCIDFYKVVDEPNGLDALFCNICYHSTLGDTSGVKNDGNEVNAGGWTALQCASMNGKAYLITQLVERFPNIDGDLSYRLHSSPLCLAMMYGHPNCIVSLSANFPGQLHADNALQAACHFNRTACIPTMHACFPHITGNEADDNFFYSRALMTAARYNNPACIRLLRSCFYDIDPNLQDEDGNTALIAAARCAQDTRCVAALLECFPTIDPDMQDHEGNTALMWVLRQGLSNWIPLLGHAFPNLDLTVRNKQGRNAFLVTVFTNIKCLVVLRQYFPKIDPNEQNSDGNTAIMLVVCRFSAGPVLTQLRLLFPNIDPNIQNKNQDTALLCMLKSHNSTVTSVCEFLDIFPNVDVTIQNAQGETALTIAIKKNDGLLVSFLLKRFSHIYTCPNQHINNNGNNSPTTSAAPLLMLAVINKRFNVIPVLLQHIIDTCQD